ncbi:DUF2339 domain-containing protein [Vitiosangium sp. GDMCC 1.1324]|uniref:DUF2339 domain-containing protein n=1 Tax=Vitiosangium sp. (strain GDMCC 1.1324) TaxID=2138576 RepID=UPI000D3BEFB2|nr:DUF2339 domain-containing protein [Vitiosangium sp. GDMCC 1.1324]PTL83921.1 DUF2339 domain-containing protein [Vitiosangium sp. GDMCC 1.1324]
MAEGEGQDLRDVVRRLEETVSRLEARIEHLETAARAEPALPRAPAAPPPSTEPAPEKRDLEAHLGTYWLSRVGIVALIIGFAFLIIYHFGELGVLVRVGAGYLLSAGLAALGLWLSRRHLLFGRIVFGGGLALAYFVTYALHFVPAVRVIQSETLALVLLALNVVGIVVIAQRMQSETVAGIALFLGLHTGMLSDITLFTLMSTTMLASGALFFLVKNRWVIVPLSSLVAVYSTHVVWAMRTGSIAPGQPDSERLALSLSFLALYYVLFSVALLVHPRELSKRAAFAFALLNWVGLLTLGAVEVSRWGEPHLFAFFVTVALAQGTGAAVARWRGAPPALIQAYLATSILTLAMGMPSHFEDTALVRAWTAVGLVAGLAGRVLGAGALQVVGVGILYVALGATWLPPSGRAFLDAALLVSFTLVERASVASTARLPPPLQGSRRTALQFFCAAGAGLALVWLVGEWMPSDLTTLGWGMAAFGLFALGFAVRERWYRLVGLAVLAITLGRLMLIDLAGLPPNQRILTFILLGVMLLAVSYVYTRLRGSRS